MKLATTLAIFLSALVLADNRPFPLIPVIPRPPPGSAPEAHGNTECWPYKNPDCCVHEPVCECITEKFYEYNGLAACQPPGAIFGAEKDIPGYCC
ncbi:hypothetical protein M432DRAFT_613556 [Thermoascus aurantiacus ATCC 26904]